MSFLSSLLGASEETYTENGAKAFLTSGSNCLDLFFAMGALRQADDEKICNLVTRAYVENPEKTMKLVFFGRDIRGGLGERRFFRVALKQLADIAPESVKANIVNIPEYGRYDDLLALIDTSCSAEAVAVIKERLNADITAMKSGEPASLLAKWLPSVNASSAETKRVAKKLCKMLGMNEATYRKTLAELRKYIDIIENRLREEDYTFDYSKQPSGAMFKYRKAFIRNDEERYINYLKKVQKGEAKLNAGVLYPYEVVRRCLDRFLSDEERLSLDVTWNNLTEYGNNTENSNALAVVDASGSMTCVSNGIRPLDVSLSLGLYFAEHNKGAFANHFITFSEKPRLIKVEGKDITEKVRYCAAFNQAENTDLEAVFELILRTACEGNYSQADMPSRLYIISDMQFDYCIEGGNNSTIFNTMKRKYEAHGYKLPEIVFWNVNSRCTAIPVKVTDNGCVLVSGATPSIFDMVKSGEISPMKIMNDVLENPRYDAVRV